MKCPPMVEPNQTFEVVIEFERIDSDVDGAAFDTVPEVAA